MRQRELIEVMGADEIVEWMAYDITCDPESKEKLEKQIHLENQRAQTAEQEAAAIRQLFMSFRNDGNNSRSNNKA